jgi:uncharacterized protein
VTVTAGTMDSFAATFRFYEELNDFLAPDRRGHEFVCACARAATTKHMIEACGVPHTEVELVLVNGESVGFDRLLGDGDRVAVYPKFEALDIGPLLRVRERPLRVMRFIADAHLGGLARLLRMSGFDTLHDNHLRDDEIERISGAEGRIVLTRDRELLKRRGVTHGCYVHALRPAEQLREIFTRLDLARSARPFTLCLCCNAALHSIDKSQAAPLLPPNVRAHHEHFSFCSVCERVFWEGSHWRRMRSMLDQLLAPS